MELFFEIYSGLPRLGPGNRESTARAFSKLTDLPDKPRILDIGCGNGMQTFHLAELTDGEIVALDNHKPYLDELERKAKEKGLNDRIEVIQGDMFHLTFEASSFDIIWSEGAVYFVGFEKGFKEWKKFLKPRGHMAVTELTWLHPNPPEEVKGWLQGEYPPMTSIDNNLKAVENSGYEVVEHFPLPESAWWDDYYIPLEKKVAVLREKYSDNKEALQLIEESQKEIDIYRKYSDFYGYVFYVGRLV